MSRPPANSASEPEAGIDAATDVDLLQRACTGDRDAFGELYDRHVRAVYWQAFRVVRDADAAEDVTQETFVVAWRRLRTIRLVDGSVLPWLLVTARQLGLNTARKAARRRTTELDETAPSPHDVESQVEAELARVEIDAAVAALGELDQRLYALCIDGDHSYEQAARELGVTHAVVRNRLHRLRSRLRADLRAMRETTS